MSGERLSVVKTGVHIWTCDECGTEGTWGPSWRWYGRRERKPKSDEPWPEVVVCSNACKEAWLSRETSRG